MRDGYPQNRTRAATGKLSSARMAEHTRGLRVAEFLGIRAYAWSSPEQEYSGCSETGLGRPRIMIRSAQTKAALPLRPSVTRTPHFGGEGVTCPRVVPIKKLTYR